MFSCLHPWVIDWSVTGPSNCLILKLLLVIFSLQTSLPGYNKRPFEVDNPQNVSRDIMESYFSKKMNVIGKYILEKLTKCTFSSLSGRKEGREERCLHTVEKLECFPSFSFLPLSDLFLEEKGEEMWLLNSGLWDVRSSSRVLRSMVMFPSLFSYCCSVLQCLGFFLCLSFIVIWFHSPCFQQEVFCCLLKLLTWPETSEISEKIQFWGQIWHCRAGRR